MQPRRLPILVTGLFLTLPLVVLAPQAAGKTAATMAAKTPAKTPATAPAEKKLRSVAYFSLSDALLERPGSFTFSLSGLAGSRAPALSNLIVTLQKALHDPQLGGVYLDLQGFSLTANQAYELGQQLQELKHHGKRVVVYAADFEIPTYLLASYADTVVMPESGNLMIPGLHVELLYWKGLLDKLHISADMVQVGKFKGAEEPYTRNEASPEFAQQIEGLLDGMYAHILSTIRTNRQLTQDEVKAVLDQGWITGKQAKDLGLVDHLMYRDEVEEWLDSQFEEGCELVADYGEKANKKPDLSNPFALLQWLFAPPKVETSTRPGLAIVYADGVIGDDSADDGGTDDLVTPDRIRKALEQALSDPLIKAIVLRIDSPGGSASASDQIWKMLRAADERKPVYVSMGHEAASGGYYIACAGRSISADPTTITGSIGVIGGKVIYGGLLEWAGLHVQSFSRGKHAGLFSAQRPFSPEERTFIAGLMGETYQQFLDRINETRRGKIPQLADVAQGRLFTGEAALKNGLVDRIATLQETLALVAKDVHLPDDYQLQVYPEPRQLMEVLQETLGLQTRSPALLSMEALPARYRRALRQVLQMTRQLEHQRVMLALPMGWVEGSR